MSEKFDKFKVALEALCREHRCTIASSGYDSPAVYDLGEFDEPIYQGCLADMTGENMDGK